MCKSMLRANSILSITLGGVVSLALVTTPGQSRPTIQTDKNSAGADKATPQVKEETIDLIPDIKGKRFSDGKHLIRTLPSGLKISIVTRNNEILDVLFTDKDGKEEKGKPKEDGGLVTRKKGAPTQKKPPCTRIVCHGSTTTVIGADGQIESETTTNTCTRLPCHPETANPFENDPPSGSGSGTAPGTQQNKAKAKPSARKP